MKFEEFKQLSEDEQHAVFTEMQINKDDLMNAKAELASFAADNKAIEDENKHLIEELQKTKEMNFSLARKLNVGGEKADAETLIYNMFK